MDDRDNIPSPVQSVPLPRGAWERLGHFLAVWGSAYFVLYAVPFPLTRMPFLRSVVSFVSRGWESCVAAAGRSLFGVSVPLNVADTGSGDVLISYVEIPCLIVLSGLIALLFSTVTRFRRFDTLAQWASWTYVRWYLAAMMLDYGFIKIFRLQFPEPSAFRMAQTYGESSPMGLLWTLMGLSGPYQMFAGVMEALAGVLLFFRRTSVLGALLGAGVMSNVVMMNLCFDVPVKLFSSHLLLMAVFIAAPSASRIARFFVFGGAPGSVDAVPVPEQPWIKRVAPFAIVVGIILLTASSVLDVLQYDRKLSTSLIRGFYDVTTVVRNGAEVQNTGGTERWSQVMISDTALRVRFSNVTSYRYRSKEDAQAKTLALTPWGGDRKPCLLTYVILDDERITLTGEIDGAHYEMTLKRIVAAPSLLQTRGFHWVNEYPYNF